jgi:TPR repeat protein
MHELGLGAQPNLQSAARWYALALDKGLRDLGQPYSLY